MLVFDIETAVDPNVLPLMEPVAPAANLKDPVKIAESIRERTAARDDALSLSGDTGRIVCVGFTTPEGAIEILVCRDVHEEADAIMRFWHEWRHAGRGENRVGFNCVGFDLPFLINRTRILGYTPPPMDLRKYGSQDCTDLMLVLSHGGLTQARGLKWWAKRFALDVPADPTSGKDVAGLVSAEDWQAIADHCRADVATTRALAGRLGIGE